MIPGNFIDDLAKCLHEMIPPGMRDAQKDVEKNIRAVMQSAFAKLDLVTREEFDAQTNVLAKTRHKLETLEKHVAELEKKHSHTSDAKSHTSESKSHQKGRHKAE